MVRVGSSWTSFILATLGMRPHHGWSRPNGTAYTAAEATAASVAAGLDLNCGGMFGSHLRAVYDAGAVTPAMVDAAVRRVVRGYFELGLFQDTAAARAPAFSFTHVGFHPGMESHFVSDYIIHLPGTVRLGDDIYVI